MHLKVKKQTKEEREAINEKYYIPGYSNVERTVAKKPSFIATKSKELHFPQSHTPDSSNPSSSMENSSISSFLDSESIN